MVFQASRQQVLEINTFEDMDMFYTLPLVVVIDRSRIQSDTEPLFYKIDDSEAYQNSYENVDQYFLLPIDDVEALCKRYGALISKEVFDKAKIAYGLQRYTSEGDILEFRAKFETL